MALRGGRGSSSAGRETRSTTLNAKASSKGGVSKKRHVPRKTDTDGDLDMSAAAKQASKSNAPKSKPPPRSSTTKKGASKTAQNMVKHLTSGDPSTLAARVARGGQEKKLKGRAHSDGLTYLRIYGLKKSRAASNADGGLQSLLSFLERKASALTGTGRSKRSVIIKKSHLVGNYVFIATSEEDAAEILKIDSMSFAGVPLEIIESTEGLDTHSKVVESEDTRELREILRNILSQRYVGANKLLKLDSLATDPELLNLGAFENKDRAVKTLKGLMAVCDSNFKTIKEKNEAIESISLAQNNIDDVAQVESVAITFPHLKNLDISGNQISGMQGLERWKGKFRNLETLFMSGNPIEAADPTFQNTVLEWFPSLQNINGTVLRTPEQVAQAQQAASKHHPIPQRGPDFRDVNGIGETFLVEFFASFDNDRAGLASRLYDEKSQFSLAVDTNSVRANNVPTAPWAPYIKASRNLLKITTQNARVQRLFKGGNVISELWKTLPATRHPDIKQDISKYIMDCHPMGGLADPTNQNPSGVDGLIVSVHGEFDEHEPKTDTLAKRSFSRTFILGPGQPGRGAIRVVSDMLSLRAFNPLPNVFGAEQGAESTTAQDPRQAVLESLCKQTGMTPQYSEMCLSQVDWNLERALVIFSEKKAQLPAEAFAQVA